MIIESHRPIAVNIAEEKFPEELLKQQETSRLIDPQYGQTLCTVLQVAKVDLLRSFGLRPRAVVGHSSGEIAAALVTSGKVSSLSQRARSLTDK